MLDGAVLILDFLIFFNKKARIAIKPSWSNYLSIFSSSGSLVYLEHINKEQPQPYSFSLHL